MAAIEGGGRQLRLDEFLVLPEVFGIAAGRSIIRLSDLAPLDAVVLTSAVQAGPGDLTARLSGRKVTLGSPHSAAEVLEDWYRDAVARRWPEVDVSLLQGQGLKVEAGDEMVRRTALRLAVDALTLVLASRILWGHGLREERDARAATLDPPPSNRALGHVTSALETELAPILDELIELRTEVADALDQAAENWRKD